MTANAAELKEWIVALMKNWIAAVQKDNLEARYFRYSCGV